MHRTLGRVVEPLDSMAHAPHHLAGKGSGLLGQGSANLGTCRDSLDQLLELGAPQDSIGHLDRQAAVEHLLDDPSCSLVVERGSDRVLDVCIREHPGHDALRDVVFTDRLGDAVRQRSGEHTVDGPLELRRLEQLARRCFDLAASRLAL